MAVSDFCFNVPGRPQFDAQDSAFRHFEGRGMGGGEGKRVGMFTKKNKGKQKTSRGPKILYRLYVGCNNERAMMQN